ncbi:MULTISPECIES: curli-like amyloid fiber formation chaperone CsgH [Bosea]|uniref:curli-like amyloid fiber formation chaperone CsgH n=1 Tax=Bosea TaxID=85413 RepID=UPI00214F97BF|nr:MULTISPECIES: curli-like amyloid fiber formation chaperone CsgH [Bosea]MCR4524328.1 hypothetical protein [Bosea sp. 47.2.35]MDR6831232.1 hypothetical protein [Bosea robiniae]MDR6897958.1 hypothetical protein [Bosea sp. BE109]MDR7141369.1 hypothetical protein [Bosea sp. BE168]MDR7178031.1 hypothetical protein [Bosea sp. BE271]
MLSPSISLFAAGSAVFAVCLVVPPASGFPVKPPMADSRLVCELRVDDTGTMLRLRAVAKSPVAVAGRYQLSVLKQNQAGTSQNQLGGSFSLANGGESILTTVMLERQAMGHYTASLSLESDRGSVSCTSP